MPELGCLLRHRRGEGEREREERREEKREREGIKRITTKSEET